MNHLKPLNILFTSVGRRSYLIDYFKKELAGRGKVFATNSTWVSSALEIADEKAITPLIYDQDYIPFLLNYSRENNIAAIIPLLDIDLPVLAKSRSEFEKNGTRVIVSDESIINICNDKWEMYSLLKKHHFPTIPTYNNLSEAIDALQKKELHFPVMVKPRWGMGSLSIYEATNKTELRVLYKKIQRELFQSYLRYESAIDPKACIIIQEKIIGNEYGLDNICDLQGEYVTTIIRRKIAMRSGETDCAEIIKNQMLHRLGKKLATITKHIANMDIDLIISNKVPYIIDINARFGGGYPFSHMAGINLPAAIIKWLNNEPTDKRDFTSKTNIIFQKDIHMIKLNHCINAMPF